MFRELPSVAITKYQIPIASVAYSLGTIGTIPKSQICLDPFEIVWALNP